MPSLCSSRTSSNPGIPFSTTNDLIAARPAFLSSVAQTTTSSARSPAVTKRSEEHTSELQSLMRSSYAVFCLKKKQTHTLQTVNNKQTKHHTEHPTVTYIP